MIYVFLTYLISNLAFIKGQEPIELSVTYNLPELERASIDPTNAVYFYASLCEKGINSKKQAVLQLYDASNIEWNTTNNGFPVVQVSICENDFSADCVIATNYKWGVQVDAVPNISWTIGNETVYFIRVMAGYAETDFSMELSFINSTNTFSYPYISNTPFNGYQMFTSPNPLGQYWKSNVLYTVQNNAFIKFSVAFCDQGQTIKGINIALSTPPNVTDYSLVDCFACPQTITVNDCTYSNSLQVGWYNDAWASFSFLPCTDDSTKNTQNGIWIGVSGLGANTNAMNTFLLYATIST